MLDEDDEVNGGHDEGGVSSLVAFASLAAQNVSMALSSQPAASSQGRVVGADGRWSRRRGPDDDDDDDDDDAYVDDDALDDGDDEYAYQDDDEEYVEERSRPRRSRAGSAFTTGKRKRGRGSDGTADASVGRASGGVKKRAKAKPKGASGVVRKSSSKAGGGGGVARSRSFMEAEHGASSRKPVDDSGVDGTGSARALVGHMYAENPRLATLVNSLSSRVRHFAMFEWFYPTVDRDYFTHNMFRECLEQVNLRHVDKLTRTEWSALRAALGKPRRLSPAFLREERRKLEGYRRIVREVQKGTMAAPPPEFMYEVPAALVVGQTVSAYHRRAKLLSRGQILTADYDRGLYRVQFERPELGTELCLDTDIAVHGSPILLYAKPRREEPYSAVAPPLPSSTWAKGAALVEVGKDGDDCSDAVSMRPRLMVFILKMLDRKEALLSALRELNVQAEAAAGQQQQQQMPGQPPQAGPPQPQQSQQPQSSSSSVRRAGPHGAAALYSPVFKQQYSWVMSALQKTNQALGPALEKLRLLVAGSMTEGSATTSGTSTNSSSSDAAAPVTGSVGSTAAPGGLGPLFEIYYGMRVSPAVKAVVESSKQNARMLYQHHTASSSSAGKQTGLQGEQQLDESFAPAVTGPDRGMQGLIEACAGVILALRQAADQRRLGLMTALDVDHSVKAALQELKQMCRQHPALYHEIESSVSVCVSVLERGSSIA